MKQTSQDLDALVSRSLHRLRNITEDNAAEPLHRGGWSPKQVLGHLIDSASNNHQRFVRAALQGELDWPSYDQEGCVRVEAFQDAPWPMLIEIWSAMNRLLVHILAHLPDHAATFRCRIGGEADLSLSQLAASYVDHMRHHLTQLGAV